MMWIQLMQPYVQKSSKMNFPFNAAIESGLSVFNQPRPPVISGARTLALSCTLISDPFFNKYFDSVTAGVRTNTSGNKSRTTKCLVFLMLMGIGGFNLLSF